MLSMMSGAEVMILIVIPVVFVLVVVGIWLGLRRRQP
jgi:hypothetical protein